MWILYIATTDIYFIIINKFFSLKAVNSEIMERYISGKADEDEKEQMESAFLSGESNIDLKHILEKDWNYLLNTSQEHNKEMSHILDHIHQEIKKKGALKRKNNFRRILGIYSRVAAVLLFPLLTAGVLLYILKDRGKTSPDQNVVTTIYSPFGARVSFNLPDGTTGKLNSGSILTYSLPFSDKRNVTLEGEAWFEVCRDVYHPFEIRTGTSLVKVLGTSFNISAYPTENYIEVVLLEGKVDFSDKKLDKIMNLLPSERLVYQNGSVRKSKTDPAKYFAWTEGKLVFRGDPMAEVARRIERWYNVKVILADPELEKYSFRATFQDDPLEEVLRLLSMTSPISFKIAPRTLLTDGIFNKEEVTIYKRK